MYTIALSGVILCGIMVSIMAEIRKLFQTKNGAETPSTIFFILASSIVAVVVGMFFSKDFQFEKITFALALCYAVINTVLAYICVVGTAYGNMTILITCATLGSLVIPGIYGIVTDPEVNRLTAIKITGYLLSFASFIPILLPKGEGVKGRLSVKFKIMCITAFVFQGLPFILFILKQNLCGWYSEYSFITECMLLSVFLTFFILTAEIIKNKSGLKKIKNCLNPGSLALTVSYGVVFIVAETLSLWCVGRIPIIIQTPLSSSIPILTVSILDFAIHKETLSKKQMCQVLCAILSSICFVI